MKIPKKVKIGGHWFEVVFRSEKRDHYEGTGAKLGWRNRIVIQADMVQSKKETALIHEVIHEITFQGGFDLRESEVTTLASILYQVLVDNKLLR